MPPRPIAELFGNITANFRFVPFDREARPAPLRLPDEPTQQNDGIADDRPLLSHAVPLKGGYSGTITMHWVARTPVLFGGEQKDQITLPQRLHAGPDAPYCISGSAQRGMIRRLLRIATKGKIGPVGDTRPALRDPSYQQRRVGKQTRVGMAGEHMVPPKAGWLCFDPDAAAEASPWSIKPCIDTAIAHADPAIAALGLAHSNEKSVARLHGRLNERICAAVAAAHGGHLILSGAMPGQKTHEFVFGPALEGRVIPVSEAVFQNFRQAYGKIDDRKKQRRLVPDSNLAHWLAHSLHDHNIDETPRKAMAACFDVTLRDITARRRPDHPPGIPVWYYPATKDHPLTIGMSQIMRFPAHYTVGEVLTRTQPNRATLRHDWADAMLGFVDGDKGQRGRIAFGFGTAMGNPAIFPPANRYVGVQMLGPRVGFAGLYLRRHGADGTPDEWDPATYDSDKALSAGRKLYPVWRNWGDDSDITLARPLPQTEDEKRQAKTLSFLKMLPSGTVFQTRIDVHNLLPEELGALLWVLSLGDATAFAAFDPTQTYARPFDGLAGMCHTAGRGRSFGFGNLIPAGISLDGVICHDQVKTQAAADANAEVAMEAPQPPASPNWQSLIAAFARSVHGVPAAEDADALAALHQVPRLARLRHLSNRLRDAELSGLRWPPGDNAQFKDYRRLREAASGQHNRDYRATLAATPPNDLGGNILDYGSDPAKADRPS